jgi:putative two-component system hydrogenase maturation factor HypX/HoxX
VTLLQAADEMDAGDIWGSQNFPLRRVGKTSIYKGEVSSTAIALIALIKRALENIAGGLFTPRSLNYTRSQIKGRLRPTMKQKDRRIDWQMYSTAEIVSRLTLLIPTRAFAVKSTVIRCFCSAQ